MAEHKNGRSRSDVAVNGRDKPYPSPKMAGHALLWLLALVSGAQHLKEAFSGSKTCVPGEKRIPGHPQLLVIFRERPNRLDGFAEATQAAYHLDELSKANWVQGKIVSFGRALTSAHCVE